MNSLGSADFILNCFNSTGINYPKPKSYLNTIDVDDSLKDYINLNNSNEKQIDNQKENCDQKKLTNSNKNENESLDKFTHDLSSQNPRDFRYQYNALDNNINKTWIIKFDIKSIIIIVMLIIIFVLYYKYDFYKNKYYKFKFMCRQKKIYD